MLALAGKPRQKAGPQEGRLAGTRCAEDDKQSGCSSLSQPPQPVEPDDGGAVAAKEDAGILGFEWLKTAIGRALGIVLWRPNKIACVEPGLHQADA